MVPDALNFLTFVQTTGSATVEAFDFSVDNILDDAFTYTNVYDLGAASPNWDGQSIYVRPVADVNGAFMAGSSDATVALMCKLVSGATTSPTVDHAGPTQVLSTELIEIPLPQDVARYIKVGLQSDGGAGTAHITKGAAKVYIGMSGRKEK